MASKKKRPSNCKVQDDQELAIILSHAATFGTGASAKEFGLNRKTIQRYQKDIREGKRPELAALVAAETEKSKARSRDKMQKAIDVLLDRAIQLAPSAQLGEVVNAIEKIGDLAGSWKVMGVKPDSEGEAPSGNAVVGGQDAGGAKHGLRVVGK